MKITEKQIEEMANEYAENENSAYTNDYYGFINGFKKALTLLGVSDQNQCLTCDLCSEPVKVNKKGIWIICSECGYQKEA